MCTAFAFPLFFAYMSRTMTRRPRERHNKTKTHIKRYRNTRSSVTNALKTDAITTFFIYDVVANEIFLYAFVFVAVVYSSLSIFSMCSFLITLYIFILPRSLRFLCTTLWITCFTCFIVSRFASLRDVVLIGSREKDEDVRTILESRVSNA